MKTTKTLSIIAENQENFDPADYTQFEIGSAQKGQIRCYYCNLTPYIALINPQEENRLWSADEFPYEWFSRSTQNAIDRIFKGKNLHN